ncbi:MAG TPA: winged helix-turn-helix domain-containing protein [Xanthobacteraceae bacterium]|nr:winged helix-turn-helix domain-containing protein [Xanthobacteraceae bacterium]
MTAAFPRMAGAAEDFIEMRWADYMRRECVYLGRRVQMTPRHCDILSILLLNRGQMLTTNEIIERLWPDPDLEPEWPKDTVRTHIYQLRNRAPGIIETIGSQGYMVPLPGHWSIESRTNASVGKSRLRSW